jgi:predicted Holliday junction resolvase-like endonuclease
MFEKLIGSTWARIAAGVLLLLLIVWLARCDAYRDGVSAEQARQQEQIQKDAAAQRERERKADEKLREGEAQARQAAEQRTQEIDNATRDIPDQAPSARQRSRACIELRRQAAANGGPQPAC